MSKFYYEIHQGNGPYLLLLHGIMSSRAQWALNLAELKKYTTPVVVESWGHGRAPSPEDVSLYSPEAYVDQIEAIRKEIGTETWFICGHSFGATTTLRYALRYPQRVKGQIFTNSTSALVTPDLMEETYQEVATYAATLREHGNDGLEDVFGHPIKATRLPDGAQAALMADAPLLNAAAIANIFQYNMPFSSIAEQVPETAVPTLLVVGKHEKRFEPLREFGEKNIPGLEVVSAAGGHSINIAAADTFNQAVIDFVERNK